MTKSQYSRAVKFFSKEIFTDKSGNRYIAPLEGRLTMDLPPHKVGKEFPYENQRRARQLAVIQKVGSELPEDTVDLEEYVANSEAAVAKLTAPHIKSPEQMQTEAAWFGKNRHQLVGRKPTHKSGGDGTVLSSSKRKPYRNPFLRRNGHYVMPIELEYV